MKILMFSIYYWPEFVGAAVNVQDLAEGLVLRGHEVTVATTLPSYPKGYVFEGYASKKLIYREEHNGVQIIRLPSFITTDRSSLIKRGLHYVTSSLAILLGGYIAKKHDVIFCLSPPVTLGLAGFMLSITRRIPMNCYMQDLWPQVAVNNGLITNLALIKTFKLATQLIYRKSATLTVVGKLMREDLIELGVKASKIHVVPTWTDVDFVKPMDGNNAFRQRQGLEGKFIVLYAGLLGLTSNLNPVILAAELLKEYEQIQFVIIGDGYKKPELVQKAKSMKLENISFLPFQPLQDVPEMLASADIALVALAKGASRTSVPGKTFNYMASQRPIIAIAEPNSEVSQIVDAANNGICVEIDEHKQLAQAILKLYNDPDLRQCLGTNGRNYVIKHFSKERCISMHEQVFEESVTGL